MSRYMNRSQPGMAHAPRVFLLRSTHWDWPVPNAELTY
jgi:hypothetical protein